MSGVCAVVVTHNRRHMLQRCLAALGDQRRAPDRSWSSTTLRPTGQQRCSSTSTRVEVLSLASNEGGAGGFHEGIKHTHAAGAEWLWLMDDDTIPTAGALAELLDAAERLAAAGRLDGAGDPALLASRVVWRDGTLHPMNYPILERRRMELVIAGAEHGVAPIRGATFVSLLVHRRAIERYGLPLKHFFLWTDDIEYTSRVVLGGEGAYFVPASVALHDTAAPEDFRTARPERFYCHVRNTLLMARASERPSRDRLLRLWILASTTAAYVIKNRDRGSAAAIWQGLRDGWRGGRRMRAR